jgi:hypothetical protein
MNALPLFLSPFNVPICKQYPLYMVATGKPSQLDHGLITFQKHQVAVRAFLWSS